MMRRPTVRHRLYSLLIRSFLVLVAVSLLLAWLSFSSFRRNALKERMLLARTVAHYLDATMSTTLQSLDRLAGHLPSLDAATVSEMRAFRFQSLFRDAIYVLDVQGDTVIADPEAAAPLPSRLLPLHEAVTTLFYKSVDGSRPTLAAIQPFERNHTPYFLVSEMNPRGSALNLFLEDLGTEPDLHVVVVDANGVVIAAPEEKQLFQVVRSAAVVGDRIRSHRPYVFDDSDCSVCDLDQERGSFLTVMAPLRFAPWGVLVQQQNKKAFAVLYTSRSVLLSAGALLCLIGVFLARALSKSLVSPIQSLSRQAEPLRRGDLSRPITVEGDHEVVVLATTLNDARQQLASVLGAVKALNENLEKKVASRTESLRQQYEDVRLLNAVFGLSASEGELEQWLPQALRLVAEHYSLPAVALVTDPLDASPTIYTFPEQLSLRWLEEDAPPPADWQKRELVYLERVQARLFHPRIENRDEGGMEALQRQLAMSLHGAYLFSRTVVQDAQLRMLLRRLLAASEEERKRIARELHDEISQLLTVVQLSLDDVPVETVETKRARELLTRTQKEVHRIMHDLRPTLLDDLGLPAAVRSHAENYLGGQGIQVSLEVEDDLSLPPEVEITTFRIYQEIMTNILRHASAEHVSVELYATENELVLAVEDDGVGFGPEGKLKGAGIGGMRERAALVNGRIEFTSEPGMGTHVVLTVPLTP